MPQTSFETQLDYYCLHSRPSQAIYSEVRCSVHFHTLMNDNNKLRARVHSNSLHILHLTAKFELYHANRYDGFFCTSQYLSSYIRFASFCYCYCYILICFLSEKILCPLPGNLYRKFIIHLFSIYKFVLIQICNISVCRYICIYLGPLACINAH